jgi:hypothetical protein
MATAAEGERTEGHGDRQTVEMPRPNVWPMVLSLGIVLTAAGVAMSPAFFVVGGVLFAVGLAGWISELLPGRGHEHEPLLPLSQRAQPVTGTPGLVEHLLPGMSGYRVQLPEKVHPISAGVKGGIVAGIVMLVPALGYGVVSGNWIWYPVNLLAGMVLPGLESMTLEDLRQFHLSLLVVGAVIHAVISVVFGLIYGVLLPTLADIPRPLAWGGLLMPLFWTAVSFTGMGVVNPLLARGVDWPAFIFSQFLFGLATALVVMRTHHLRPVASGALCGLVGGLLMPIPAVLWSLGTRHGVWYPVNLLAGMIVPGMGHLPPEELLQFHGDWLAYALAIHAALSIAFGVLYALLLDRLPSIPGPLSWGGVLMPLLWTGASYGLMGVVNPVLQERVDWPWFVVSQFVFGLAAAIVVVRSEQIAVPPAGHGRREESGPSGELRE